jgi:hypothetical protein
VDARNGTPAFMTSGHAILGLGAAIVLIVLLVVWTRKGPPPPRIPME